MLPLASIFSPFESLSESIIKFFQGTIGLSWGLSIIALTFTSAWPSCPFRSPASARCDACRSSRRS